MSAPTPNPGQHLGFLGVFKEASGFQGGYLITNSWGRPLEFRLTSAVQPTRVQQILYGDSLQPYLYSNVIGKALIEKATTQVQYIIVDNSAALELRRHTSVPVGVWHALVDPDQAPPGLAVQPRLCCHVAFPEDVAALSALVETLGSLDFAEPFTRIREAMSEARKLGVGRLAA